jgi:hypothetical protein
MVDEGADFGLFLQFKEDRVTERFIKRLRSAAGTH